MASNQDYLSSTLYHYLGRSSADDEIFKILIKILSENCLLYDPDGSKLSAVPAFSADSLANSPLLGTLIEATRGKLAITLLIYLKLSTPPAYYHLHHQITYVCFHAQIMDCLHLHNL